MRYGLLIGKGCRPPIGQRKAKQGESCTSPTSHLRTLRQALDTCRRALEEFESTLQEFEEEAPDEKEKAPARSLNGQNLRLLSLPEVCQELGEERTVVHQRLRSGEIPSLKLGRSLKVRQPDLEEYIRGQRGHHPPGEKNGLVQVPEVRSPLSNGKAAPRAYPSRRLRRPKGCFSGDERPQLATLMTGAASTLGREETVRRSRCDSGSSR